jgi:hypothetical protein
VYYPTSASASLAATDNFITIIMGVVIVVKHVAK